MENSGDNADYHLNLEVEMIEIGKGAKREVEGYRVTRKGAYALTLEADPSKPEVAVSHRYMIETTRKGEIAENVFNTMKDKSYIDARDGLRVSNRELSATLLRHDVKEDELSIVHSAGDKGMFNKSTQELKVENGIPNSRPTADFLGDRIATAKKFAQDNSRDMIERQNANGVKECSDITYNENRKVRDMVIASSGDTPENLITGEDVKKVEQRYKKLTKQQIEAINQEF